MRYPILTATASSVEPAILTATARELGEGILEATATVPDFDYLFATTSRVQGPEMWLEHGATETRSPISLSARVGLEGQPDFTVRWAGLRPWPAENAHACIGWQGEGFELRGRYWSASGAEIARYLLIGDGETLSSAAGYSKTGIELTLSGTVAGQRREKAEVDYRLEAGSGKPRSTAIREIAAEAGVTATAIYAGGTISAPIEIAEQPWWETAAGLAALAGQRLYWRGDGTLATCPKRISQADGIVATISTANLRADDSISLQWPAEVVTEIRASGSETVSDPCETVTTETTQKIYAFRPPLRATAVIETDGTLTDISNPGASALILDREILTRRETRCGTEVSTYVRESGWKIVETWRFTIEDGGTDPPGPVTRDTYNDGKFIFAESPALDGTGTEPAYLDPFERWRVLSETWVQHRFDGEGWKIGTVTYRKGWRWPETAIKTATIAEQNWPGVNLVPGLPTAGDGRGIGAIGQSEAYTLGAENPTLGGPFQIIGNSVLSHEVVTHVVVDGYIAQTTVEVFGWRRPAGNLALYSDGSTSLYPAEQYGIISREVTLYEAISETSHRMTRIKTSFLEVEYGAPDPQSPMESSELEGYLPAAERLAEMDPTAAAQSKPIETIVRAESLSCWPTRTERKSYTLAENQADLMLLATDDLADGAAVKVGASMPACYALAAGQVVFLDLPELGIQRRARLFEVVHSTGPGPAESRTQFEARYSPGFDAP